MEDKVDETEEQEKAPAPKDDKEAKRLARVIEKLQKDNEEKEKLLAELSTKHEREKLEESERLKLELQDARKQAEALAREKEELAAAQTRKETVWNLVVDHGLLTTDFGDIVLKGFDPDKSTLEEHVAKAKKDKRLKVLFKPDDAEEGEKPPGPHGGAGSRNRKTTDGISDEDKARARTLFPHDARKQELFLERLKTSSRGK